MPIYKIPRRGQVKASRGERAFSRLRLVFVVLSVLLISTTVALLIYSFRAPL